MIRRLPALVCFAAISLAAAHAAPPTSTAPAPVTALFLSDTHLDPFHDPAKVPSLAAAPVSQWQRILAAAPSPTQAADFTALQQKCQAKGVDTDYALFASTLAAIKQNAADAKFITVSGDLLAHKFPCRFAATLPKASPADYEAFAEKTIAFQAAQLRAALPHATVFLALGNNDSNCDDYRLDPATPFLKNLAAIAGPAAGAAWSPAAAQDFADGGNYSALLPAPITPTRLVVLDDIFLSAGYATCSGQPDAVPAARQLNWLRTQIADARAHHQRVWVMAHIPTGVNPYSSLKNGHDAVCGPSGTAKMFLANEDLAVALAAAQPDLVLFAHTHMDELRLLFAGDPADPATPATPVKLIPSISPVDGNHPTFTVAQIDPATAALADYTVYVNPDAHGAAWQREYTFSQTYGLSGFTAANVRKLVDTLRSDPHADRPQSLAYLRYYTSGALTDELKPFWQDYACALANDHRMDFIHCACDR